MANVSRIQGLNPLKHLNGSSWNGALETFAVLASDATALGIGDVVKWGGTADPAGVPTITRMTSAADLPIGVIQGFNVDTTNLNNPNFRPASTLRYALVVVDPTVVYEVQAAAATAVTAVAMNMDLVYNPPVALTGLSGMQAAGGAGAVTATLPLKVVGVSQRQDQDMSDPNNWKLLVTLNTNNLSGNTAGVA